MKTVKKLKKKHRNDIWGDKDGYVWFYDAEKQTWVTIMLALRDEGNVIVPTTDEEGWPDAPFVRITRGKL